MEILLNLDCATSHHNLRWLNTVFLGGQRYYATWCGFLKIKTNMAAKSAAKIVFSLSRQLVKCDLKFCVFPKRGNLQPVDSSVRLLFGKWPLLTADFSFPCDNRDTSRDLCVTKCCENNKPKFTSFFSEALASVLLTLVFGTTAYCGESDEFSTPEKQPFYLSRTVKKAKIRARTEATRAERCKRRLFSEEGDENDPSPLVLDPPVLRERDKQAQQYFTVKRNNNIWH